MRISRIQRLIAVVALLAPLAAVALDPATPLADYHHTTWTAKDGAPTNIASMAQTTDGWLWLASKSGLHRFDGARFEQYVLPGSDALFRSRPSELYALPNGDLLISFYIGGGLSALHPDGTLEDLAVPGKDITPFYGLAVDLAGHIWIAGVSGLHQYVGGKWRTWGAEQGLPGGEMKEVGLDRHGRLWALSLHAAFLYQADSGRFQKVQELAMASSLVSSPDGRVWLANEAGVQALPAPPPSKAALLPPATPGARASEGQLFDRDGNLWVNKCPVGLCVTTTAGNRPSSRFTPADATFRLDQPWQMSSLNIGLIMEDREGNIWVGTKSGLERFRDNKLSAVDLPGSRGMVSLTYAGENGIWAVERDSGTAWRLAAGAAPVPDRRQRYQTAALDRNGALLLASNQYIERHQRGGIEKIPLPTPPGADGKPLPIAVWGLSDDGRALWMMSPQTGLMAWVDGKWLSRTEHKMPRFVQGAADGPGRNWLAHLDGSITLHTQERSERYDARTIGMATGIFTGREVVAAGERGLAVFKDKAFHKLTASDPDVLRNVSGFAVTSNGDRWLNGGKGLVHVRKADWLASLAQPALPLRYELYSAHEGYRGEAVLETRLPSMQVDKDDRLWLAGTGGVMTLDTRAVRRNPVAPVVSISGLAALDNSRYAGKRGVALPEGTRSFNVLYTATSLRQPEGVRFQYRLDGVDDDWQDAGARRTALYTNMAPGAYRFHVRAANEDGVWSAQPASIAVDIPPTITQTLWFKAACVLTGAALLYLLYLYRLRIVTARLEERMEVRIAERERIARTLHDTFLQTVQGVVLRLDAAVDSLPDDSAARKSLAPVLHSARASINEGRAQVQDLRSTPDDALEAGLREVAALLAASYPGVVFALVVDGERRTLRGGVIEELSEIGREAVRNAYQHAQAALIEVRLGYEAQQFTLQVGDDGKGMTPAPASGHWGLVGMRERAARIGAALEIVSAPDQGSHVKIALPAHRAYADTSLPWWRRLFRK